MDEIKIIIIAVASVLGALIAAAVSSLFISNRKTRKRLATRGRVLRSDVQTRYTARALKREVRSAGNYAHVAYEYEVLGQK
jgi:Tfp pilus assembly protein PilW